MLFLCDLLVESQHKHKHKCSGPSTKTKSTPLTHYEMCEDVSEDRIGEGD